jgi:urease alpha subunit
MTETNPVLAYGSWLAETPAERIGSLEAGKLADLVLLDGDLSRDIAAIGRPLIVFRNGIGYDSAAIDASLSGQVGLN